MYSQVSHRRKTSFLKSLPALPLPFVSVSLVPPTLLSSMELKTRLDHFLVSKSTLHQTPHALKTEKLPYRLFLIQGPGYVRG